MAPACLATPPQLVVLFLIGLAPPFYVWNFCEISLLAPPPSNPPLAHPALPPSPAPSPPPPPPPTPLPPAPLRRSDELLPLSERELAVAQQEHRTRQRSCLSLEEREGPHPTEFGLDPSRRGVPIHVVLQYPNVMDKQDIAIIPYRVPGPQNAGRGRVRHRPARPDELLRRQNEYHYALARTLLHPQVAQVHLLLNRSADLDPVLRGLGSVCDPLDPVLRDKLRVRVLGRLMTYGEAFSHINRYLSGRHAMLMNSDVYPVGGGWRDLQPWHFGRNNRTFYMLSRFSPACPGREDLGPRDVRTCPWAARVGSADAFVFRAPVPQPVVDEMMRFPTNYWGAENRAGAALYRSGFRPLYNPCRQLALWHEHCSRVRTTGAGAPRINQGSGMSRVAPYIDALGNRRPSGDLAPPKRRRPKRLRDKRDGVVVGRARGKNKKKTPRALGVAAP